jgi:hypothetical protein
MARASMTPIKILSIPGEELTHDRGNPLPSALEEKMNVIIHQHPGKDGAFPLDDLLAQPLQEQSPIPVVFEDLSFIDPADHNVMEGPGHI